MLKLNAENKNLAVVFENKQMEYRDLLEKKEELMDELDRATDSQKQHDLRLRLAELYSGVDALTKGQKYLADVDREISLRRLKRAKEAQTLARQGATLFSANIDLITGHAFWRKTGESRSIFDADRDRYFLPRISKYFQVLREKLSYEDAQKQADEILTASLERREWKELVELPQPEKSKPSLAYS